MEILDQVINTCHFKYTTSLHNSFSRICCNKCKLHQEADGLVASIGPPLVTLEYRIKRANHISGLTIGLKLNQTTQNPSSILLGWVYLSLLKNVSSVWIFYTFRLQVDKDMKGQMTTITSWHKVLGNTMQKNSNILHQLHDQKITEGIVKPRS